MSVTILVGDCRDVLATLSAGSAQCVVTSPPYYGLRDYGVAGQIGLEQTPGEYVAQIVDVFRGVRRVLADDGTLWLNLGDSYTASSPGQTSARITDAASKQATNKGSDIGAPHRNGTFGLKPKNLIGIPWRVALALQADGWTLRQDIIWHKPNPMPESVQDRCTKAHEYLFLLSKSARYYYDSAAIVEPVAESQVGRVREDVVGGASHEERGQHSKGGTYKKTRPSVPRGGFNGKTEALADEGRNAFRAVVEQRNRRSVWTVPTAPYSGAHFATFPPALIEPCIKAGSRVGDMVLDPFGGAGTTGLVADRLGRNATLIELNPAYAQLARHRIHDDAPLFADENTDSENDSETRQSA